MRRHQHHPDPLRRFRLRRSARGLTLLELMISSALGVVVLGAALAVLLASGRMRRNQELLADANEGARTVLRHLGRTLASAGVGGSTYSYQAADGTRQQRSAIIFINGTTSLGPGMPQKPDSLILLRYVPDRRSVLMGPLTSRTVRVAPDGRNPSTPGVVPEVFQTDENALITNFQRAMLVSFQSKALNPSTKSVELDLGTGFDSSTLQDPQFPVEPGATVFPVRVVRYSVVYVPATADAPARADLVELTLNPRTLDPVRQFVLAHDIEDLQIQWAHDRNEDGVADETPDPSINGAWSDEGPTATLIEPSLTFARISVSARTSEELLAERGAYVAGVDTPFERGLDLGGPRPAATGHRRRVLSAVVLLKNLVAPRI
jgi:hypothetical protein